MTGATIPDAAIEAAAEAVDRYNEDDEHFWWESADAARAAIEAAMPAIREAIAQEIEASNEFWKGEQVIAARIVRGDS